MDSMDKQPNLYVINLPTQQSTRLCGRLTVQVHYLCICNQNSVLLLCQFLKVAAWNMMQSVRNNIAGKDVQGRWLSMVCFLNAIQLASVEIQSYLDVSGLKVCLCWQPETGKYSFLHTHSRNIADIAKLYLWRNTKTKTLFYHWGYDVLLEHVKYVFTIIVLSARCVVISIFQCVLSNAASVSCGC